MLYRQGPGLCKVAHVSNCGLQLWLPRTQTTFAYNEVMAGRIDKIIHQNEFKAGKRNNITLKYQYKALVENTKLFKCHTCIYVGNVNVWGSKSIM